MTTAAEVLAMFDAIRPEALARLRQIAEDSTDPRAQAKAAALLLKYGDDPE